MSVDSPLFDDRLRTAIRTRLESHERAGTPARELKHAAVAMAIVSNDGDDACFLLTRRGSAMRAHRSQWALPGGRVDEGETPEHAAARELDEELGVRGAEVLGCLDDYPTRSGYRITPVVLWVPAADTLVPNPDEVAAAYRIPLRELLRSDSPRFVEAEGVTGPILQVPIYDRLVHAPTAAVLYQFTEVALRGRATRVAHLEQPPFAWR